MKAVKGLVALCLMAVMGLVAGCAGPRSTQPREAPIAALEERAERLIQTLADAGTAPASVKGIGALKLQSPSGLRTARMAWIAATGGRMRLQVLGPGGQPLLSLAADSHQVTGVVHGQDRFFQRATSDPNLERIVGIPIKSSQLAALLMGRVPMTDFQSARVEAGGPGRPLRLVLKRWWRTRQIITLDPDTGVVERIEAFDTSGDLIFDAAFEKAQTIGGYRLPRVLTLSGPSGARLRLIVSRCWVDVKISPDLFVLKPASG